MSWNHGENRAARTKDAGAARRRTEKRLTAVQRRALMGMFYGDTLLQDTPNYVTRYTLGTRGLHQDGVLTSKGRRVAEESVAQCCGICGEGRIWKIDSTVVFQERPCAHHTPGGST